MVRRINQPCVREQQQIVGRSLCLPQAFWNAIPNANRTGHRFWIWFISFFDLWRTGSRDPYSRIISGYLVYIFLRDNYELGTILLGFSITSGDQVRMYIWPIFFFFFPYYISIYWFIYLFIYLYFYCALGKEYLPCRFAIEFICSISDRWNIIGYHNYSTCS